MIDDTESLGSILGTMREVQSGAIDASTPPADPVRVEGSAPASETAPVETSQPAEVKIDATGRAHGPGGKFASKTPAEQAAEGSTTQAATTDKPATEPGAAAPVTPEHWSPGDKALISELPAEHQGKVVDLVKRVESGYAPKLQQAARIHRDYGELDEVFAPYDAHLRQQGLTKAAVIKGWAGIERQLMDANQRVPTIQKLIAAYGMTPEQVLGQPDPNAPPAPYRDPDVTGLGSRVDQVGSRVEQLERQIAAERRAQEQGQQSRVESEVQAFAAKKDPATGALAYPHFERVRTFMGDLAGVAAKNGENPSLDDLYNQAVYAKPDVRKDVLATQQAAVQRDTETQTRAKADAARRASVSIPSVAAPVSPAGRELSILETLHAARTGAIR